MYRITKYIDVVLKCYTYKCSQDSDFYHFNNIRYAAPPLGDLRWRAPVPPAENTSEIQTGETDHICPQAMASWRTNLGAAFHCIHDITTNCTRAAHPDKCEWRQLKEKRKCFEDNIPPNITFPPPKLLPSNSTVPNPKNTNITEDCLFLDVTVPKPVFHRAQSEISNSAGQLAPVFVWIFGGGYAEGDKNIINTTGLISRAMQEGSEGIVSVSINYRVC
jgi:carboxylesterase type B